MRALVLLRIVTSHPVHARARHIVYCTYLWHTLSLYGGVWVKAEAQQMLNAFCQLHSYE